MHSGLYRVCTDFSIFIMFDRRAAGTSGSALLLSIVQYMGLGGVRALPAPRPAADGHSAWGSVEVSSC